MDRERIKAEQDLAYLESLETDRKKVNDRRGGGEYLQWFNVGEIMLGLFVFFLSACLPHTGKCFLLKKTQFIHPFD